MEKKNLIDAIGLLLTVIGYIGEFERDTYGGLFFFLICIIFWLLSTKES